MAMLNEHTRKMAELLNAYGDVPLKFIADGQEYYTSSKRESVQRFNSCHVIEDILLDTRQ